MVLFTLHLDPNNHQILSACFAETPESAARKWGGILDIQPYYDGTNDYYILRLVIPYSYTVNTREDAINCALNDPIDHESAYRIVNNEFILRRHKFVQALR